MEMCERARGNSLHTLPGLEDMVNLLIIMIRVNNKYTTY